MLKVAVIVGHNSVKQGAINLDGESEYSFNNDVAEQIKIISENYDDIDIKIFYREYKEEYFDSKGNYLTGKEIREVYNRVDEWGPDLSMELHFNSSSNPKHLGTEVLSSGSKKSLLFADIVCKKLYKCFNRKGRKGRRGVKIKKKGRGSISLLAGKAPAILTEPFFGSNQYDCMYADKTELAKAYFEGIVEYFNLEDL